MNQTYTGSCHCGAIAYEVTLDLAKGTSRCNCTFCFKTRVWLAFAPIDQLRLVRGADDLADYQHTPPTMSAPFLHLHFCRVCGVRPFARGGHLAAFGGEFYAVNVATLDGVDAATLAALPVKYVDGRHDDWTVAPAEHRHL